MQLIVTIDLNGGAFRDEDDRFDGYGEVARILERAGRLARTIDPHDPQADLVPLLDINGNTAGLYQLEV